MDLRSLFLLINSWQYESDLKVQGLTLSTCNLSMLRKLSFLILFSTFVKQFPLFFLFCTAKNVLRVSFRSPKDGQAHTLLAHDEHDKRQWLQWLNKALVEADVKQCPIVQEEEVPL